MIDTPVSDRPGLEPSAGRYSALDALRGIAAVAVMLHHHGQYFDVLYPGERTPLGVDFGPGHFGVELFFIISGFVISLTIERQRSVLDFAVARALRLMPSFLAALLLATLLLSLWPMPPWLETPTLAQFAANQTMAPLLFGQRPVDLPYWTLTYELVFYFYMALAMCLGLSNRLEGLGLGAVAVGGAVAMLVDLDAHRRIGILLLANYGNFFLIGICLYRIRRKAARPLTYLALVSAIAVTLRGGGEQAFHAPGPVYLLLTLAFSGAVWLATGVHGRWLSWEPLLLLGRVSYPLYLVHAVLGFEVIRYGISQGWSTASGVAAAGAVSLFAALVLHHLVERPGHRWTRQLLGRQRGVPADG